MYIFAEPVTEKQVQVIQSKNRAKIEEFERTTLDLNKETVIVPSTDAEEKDLDEVQAESEQLLKDDELASKSASRMPQFEDVSVDEATNEFGTQGTPDTSTLFNSGPLFASESVEAVSETPATSSADEVDEDEVNHSQVEANDLQDESDDAGKDEEEESPGSEVIGRGEISAEPQPASMGVMGDGIDSGETTSDDVIQESPDLEAKSTHSDDLQGEQVKVSEVEGSKPKSKDKAGAKNDDKSKPLLAMTLTIRNMVNGKYVARPERMDETDKWSVEYSIAEVANLSSAWSLYRACQTRRRKKLDDEAAGEEDVAKNYYLRRMRELSQRGREWRNMQDEMERLTIRTVLDQSRSSGPIRTDSPSVRDG